MATATPVEVPLADHLIVAGKNSELRDEGMHVWCDVYGPDEPEVVHVKRQASGELSEDEVRKVFKIQHVFGRILDHYNRLNPERKPAVLFAPGVEESLWCVDEFRKAGIRAAHIDCDDCYLGEHDADGQRVLYSSSPERRKEILDGLTNGAVQIVCNRFILREGWDCPQLYHCILATVFGSITSYLQAVGRLLRAHPSLDHVVLQDHGGNGWRHGSPNADREWDLTLTNNMLAAMREQKIREKKEPEPITCPQCFAQRLGGAKCHKCGFVCHGKNRYVVQVNGQLKQLTDDRLKPRKVSQKPDTEKLWLAEYYKARQTNKTFRQARGNFIRLHGYTPPDSLPMMPRDELAWYQKVKDVPRNDLFINHQGQ
jgi:superfamily II DNA or RNA helicase